MRGLVEHDVDITWQHQSDGFAESSLLDLTAELRPLGSELRDGGVDVVAHERQFVMRSIRRMHAELRGRQREDQPTSTGVDVVPAEQITERRSELVRLGRIQENVSTSDGHDASLSVTSSAALFRFAPRATILTGMIKHLVEAVVNYGEFAAFADAVKEYDKLCADRGLQTYALWVNQFGGRMNEIYFEASYDDEASLSARDRAENEDPEMMKALGEIIRHCAPGTIVDRRLQTI